MFGPDENVRVLLEEEKLTVLGTTREYDGLRQLFIDKFGPEQFSPYRPHIATDFASFQAEFDRYALIYGKEEIYVWDENGKRDYKERRL